MGCKQLTSIRSNIVKGLDFGMSNVCGTKGTKLLELENFQFDRNIGKTYFWLIDGFNVRKYGIQLLMDSLKL